MKKIKKTSYLLDNLFWSIPTFMMTYFILEDIGVSQMNNILLSSLLYLIQMMIYVDSDYNNARVKELEEAQEKLEQKIKTLIDEKK